MDQRVPLDVARMTEQEATGGGPLPYAEQKRKRGRRSWFRWTLNGIGWLSRAPADWTGWKTIQGGAATLGNFYQRTRGERKRDRRFKTTEDRVFDLAGTAFAYGITIEELERRLAVRRRQTATLAYALFCLACLFLLAWVWVALRTVTGGGRIVLLLQFLPFCALFYLMSFYQALLNFQIRTRRAAGWRDYLSTEERFLPRSYFHPASCSRRF
jgi:hypothetical protein